MNNINKVTEVILKDYSIEFVPNKVLETYLMANKENVLTFRKPVCASLEDDSLKIKKTLVVFKDNRKEYVVSNKLYDFLKEHKGEVRTYKAV